MKRHAILLAFVLSSEAVLANAQNLILNPGFEDGGIPNNDSQVFLATGWNNDCGRFNNSSSGSPDLFDRRSPYCHTQIPANKWGNRDTQSGGNRYVGFSGGTTPGFYAETVKGTLSAPLTACTYQVSFWASATDGAKGGPPGATPCATPLQTYVPNPDQRIEVVLRKGNDCSSGKVVFQSPPVTQKTWNYFAGEFSLTAADAAAGYDRIEFRLNIVAPNFGRYSHVVYLDDVRLVYSGLLPIDPEFQLTGSMPAGNHSTFLLQATVGNVPPGSSFWWNVEEIDPSTGAVVPNTTMTNPPAWWLTPQSTTFPGYHNNNSPNGVFVQGRTYRIRRGTWSQCNPWSEVSKTISMYSGRPPVALRAANGQWWVAEGGGGHVINANRDAIGPWEVFRLVDLGGGKVALQCVNGRFVVAEDGGGRELFCNRDAIGTWETFSKIDLGGGNIALRCANGQYVVAEGSGGGEVRCDRDAIGAWETFFLSFR